MARTDALAVVEPSAGGGTWTLPRPTTLDHLAGVSRDVQLRLGEMLAESGHHGLRPSFAPLLQLLADEALAIGRIAEELRVSPQAASRSAAALEHAGYVTRRPHAHDGRSRLVSLTARGRRLIDGAAETLARCEADYAALVGRGVVNRLLRDLDDLRHGLGLSARAGLAFEGRVRRSVGGVILLSLQARREVVGATVARGHTGIRASHLELLPIVGATGARVSEMARHQRVSRQAVSTTVQELESQGYLRRRSDDRDRRAVVFTLTARGTRLARDTVAAAGTVERRYRSVLGDERAARFERAVRALDDALGRTAGGGPGASGGPAAVPPPGDGTGDADLVRLARRLRAQLGAADAARLAALLT